MANITPTTMTCYLPDAEKETAWVYLTKEGTTSALLDLTGTRVLLDGGLEMIDMFKLFRHPEVSLISAASPETIAIPNELNKHNYLPVIGRVPKVGGDSAIAQAIKKLSESHVLTPKIVDPKKPEPQVIYKSLRTGTLELYPLSGNPNEVELLQKALESGNEQKITEAASNASVVSLIVWIPAKKDHPVKRILHTGLATHNKIIEAIDKLKTLPLVDKPTITVEEYRKGGVVKAPVGRAAASGITTTTRTTTKPKPSVAPRAAPPTRAAPAPTASRLRTTAPPSRSAAQVPAASTRATPSAPTTRRVSGPPTSKPSSGPVRSTVPPPKPATTRPAVASARPSAATRRSVPLAEKPLAKKTVGASHGAAMSRAVDKVGPKSAPTKNPAKIAGAVAAGAAVAATGVAATLKSSTDAEPAPVPVATVEPSPVPTPVEENNDDSVIIVFDKKRDSIVAEAPAPDAVSPIVQPETKSEKPESDSDISEKIPGLHIEESSSDVSTDSGAQSEEVHNAPIPPPSHDTIGAAVADGADIAAPPSISPVSDVRPSSPSTAHAEPADSPVSDSSKSSEEMFIPFLRKEPPEPSPYPMLTPFDIIDMMDEIVDTVDDDFPDAFKYPKYNIPEPVNDEGLLEVGEPPMTLRKVSMDTDDVEAEKIVEHINKEVSEAVKNCEETIEQDAQRYRQSLSTESDVPAQDSPSLVPLDEGLADTSVGGNTTQGTLCSAMEELSLYGKANEAALNEPTSSAVNDSEVPPPRKESTQAEVDLLGSLHSPFASGLASTIASSIVDGATVEGAKKNAESEGLFDQIKDQVDQLANSVEQKVENAVDNLADVGRKISQDCNALRSTTYSHTGDGEEPREIKYEETDPAIDQQVLDTLSNESGEVDRKLSTTTTPVEEQKVNGNGHDQSQVEFKQADHPGFPMNLPTQKVPRQTPVAKLSKPFYFDLVYAPRVGTECALQDEETAMAYFTNVRAANIVLPSDNLPMVVLECWLRAKMNALNDDYHSTLIPTVECTNVTAFRQMNEEKLQKFGLTLKVALDHCITRVSIDDEERPFYVVKLDL